MIAPPPRRDCRDDLAPDAGSGANPWAQRRASLRGSCDVDESPGLRRRKSGGETRSELPRSRS